MTSKTTASQRMRPANGSRLLSLVLLTLVAYSATAEAVHKHGNLLLNQTAQTGVAVSGPSETNSSLNDSRAFGDCLVCQLHQNLSTTLFSPLPQVIAPIAQGTTTPATELSFQSQSDTPRHGRAPPLPSLN
ncbi:MAG TPA: DUF2946 family protein [Pyrinomonadaceae bacterium]|nr:DUF2946 family protein [Pyrinomonadaceae bacterium]